jgi:purine-binding chemotaxis protein CheW
VLDISDGHDKSKNSGADHSVETSPELTQLIAEIDRETAAMPNLEHHQTGENETPDEFDSHEFKQYIRFSLNETLMSIPLSSSLEIGHLPDITPLPNLPDWVLGISNIRGEIVSIVDLKGFFNWPSKGPSKGSRFIIIHDDDVKLGIVVDGIMGILSLDRTEKDIQSSPFEKGGISEYTSGVVISEDQPLYILDTKKLLSSSLTTSFRAE